MTTQPTLIAYAVRNRAKGQSAIWTRIGAAWPHTDGKGLSVEITALPLDGRIVLIEPDEKAAPAEGGAA
jgi:hypothetical protein